MSEVITQSLDPLMLPLYGQRLIEASAGTGKTYTIAALYLRLLLGLGGEAAYSRPLSVDELLVVTFTEAATEELRGRIRENIHALRIACLREYSDSPLLTALLKEIDDHPLAARLLFLAEQQMDEAAIFTIHGFCQRMLSLNAFESGLLFEQQLLEDEGLLRHQACADFWRRYCYPLPKSVARVISEEWSGPEALLRDITSWLQGEAPLLCAAPPEDETLIRRHEKIVAAIDEVKMAWRQTGGEVSELIRNSGVDKRSYSTKNLPVWLAEITLWSQSETLSYMLPGSLARFSQRILDEKTRKGEVPRHPLFSMIEQLCSAPLTLRDLVITRALAEIRQRVKEEKQRRGELGFDDMLSRLDSALSQPQGERLADVIRQRFPVAMIDEFQDTDPQQYRIFRTLYPDQRATGLLLIGDPKQAIYAFRGADIFTYIRARNDVEAHYTLGTNWRSSPRMIEAVNTLFQQVPHPFLFEQIPFLAVDVAPGNHAHRFLLNGISEPGLTLWLMPGEGVGVQEYQQMMAMHCARQIRDWLMAGRRGEALLCKGTHQKGVKASDMTILVRNRHEASLVRDALSQLSIPSVYLSSRDSVFSVTEARELQWILQAVLTPENEAQLRSALATGLLGLNSLMIDTLNQDETAWDRLVEEFMGYREIWRQRGVMPMIRALITARHLAEDMLATAQGERRLTDVLHLSELLQEASFELEGEHALIRWLADHIAEPDNNASSQQLRLESDQHLVQVVTIHKSKGLEYPLVWVPFLANYRAQTAALYHDRHTYKTHLDLWGEEESLRLAEEERLAEDLRLLYVALTRAVWHCSVGIAPLFRGSRSKKGMTDVHLSALGYLIQRGEAMDAEGLQQALAALTGDAIAVHAVPEGDNHPWQPTEDEPLPLSARQLTQPVADNWRITSYSGLQQQGSAAPLELLPRLDWDAAGDNALTEADQYTPHTFPRGAAPGTFLHSLFEALDFSHPIDPQWVAERLRTQGYDEAWQPMMVTWLDAILRTPLTAEGMRLCDLSTRDIHPEMEFYLPVRQMLNPLALDALIRRYDTLSAGCQALDFRAVKGMLKGFIDLVFRWQGRYYLLDYKSNWLGEDRHAYTHEAMAHAMQSHRYDLQYQLYTLALHRYLRQRIPDYHYSRHFGGVIYLFLRGMEAGDTQQGIFTTLPDEALINGMDHLFEGEIQRQETEQ